MQDVGIRLKLTASGLELINQLRATLAAAGRDTSALDAEAAQLSAEMTRLGAAEAATTGKTGALAAESRQAAAGLVAQGDAAAKADAHLRGLHMQLTQIAAAVSAVMGGQLLSGVIGDVAKTADAYANLGARIKLVTGEGQAFNDAFKGVFDVATRTSSAVEATGELFTRIAQAGQALGVSQAQALRLTETINQAVQLSGASAESSNAAITQLIQGLQSGVLRGDEFNSVMEQAPRLAKALADGLGVTTGELRKMAEAGSLTADTVIKALQGQSAALQQEFGTLPQTVGRAIQNLSTEWTRYVGEVDKAHGISAAAAQVIQGLATHLDAVGRALAEAGKAGAAYAALKLAEVFTAKAAAARVATAAVAAETAATTANTAATAANTAATTANAQARTASAAGAATWASNGLTLLGILSRLAAAAAVASLAWDALRAAGTWIGEGAAKLAGYRDRTDEMAAAQKAAADAARAEADAQAQAAQQRQIAADRALGLSGAARKLVGDFEELRRNGSSAADALDKLSKALDLGSMQGIKDGLAALDALQQRAQITSVQVRQALQQALDGVDLGVFETQARAAFDGSEQGARRLAAVLDAIGAESLARVGTSVQEMQTGFSAALNSAINGTDALIRKLGEMGIKGEEAGNLVAKSLDKEIAAAATQRAFDELTRRIQAMGAAGQISGDQVRDALDKVQAKADAARNGINSLAEAMKELGIKSKAELTDAADRAAQSWERIRGSADVTLQQQIQAFQRYRDAAVAANGGVESSTIAVQRKALEAAAEAAGLGEAFRRAMGTARDAIDRAGDALDALRSKAAAAIDSTFQATSNITRGAKYDPNDPYQRNAYQQALMQQQGGPVDNAYAFQVRERLARGASFSADEISALQNALNAAQANARAITGSSVQSLEGINDAMMWASVFRQALERAQASANVAAAETGGGTRSTSPRNAASPTFTGAGVPSEAVPVSGGTQSPTAAPVLGVYRIDLGVGGATHSVTVGSSSSAEALVRDLEAALRARGGI